MAERQPLHHAAKMNSKSMASIVLRLIILFSF